MRIWFVVRLLPADDDPQLFLLAATVIVSGSAGNAVRPRGVEYLRHVCRVVPAAARSRQVAAEVPFDAGISRHHRDKLDICS